MVYKRPPPSRVLPSIWAPKSVALAVEGAEVALRKFFVPPYTTGFFCGRGKPQMWLSTPPRQRFAKRFCRIFGYPTQESFELRKQAPLAFRVPDWLPDYPIEVGPGN